MARLRALLVVWIALPVLALTVLHTEPEIHYFIVVLPLPFLGVAQALEAVTRRWARLGAVGILACLAGYVALDASFFRVVIRDQGARGDYGTGYRFTEEAARTIVHEARGRPVLIASNADLAPDYTANALAFLVWNVDPDRKVAAGTPELGFAELERASAPSALSGDRRWRFGPLELFEVPLVHERPAAPSR